MKFLKLGDKTKKVLKFEAKLLIGVAVLATVVYFGSMTLIYVSAEKVAQAYTQGF
ncbi:MAG TPA: hypothetical protein VF974_04950 [Patescibacteria group bacterium]